jgi:8-oxo-dGTP pyrophosphatase MutT (NUDIX family)
MSDLKFELKNLLSSQFSADEIASKFLQRIEKGDLTRDENPKSHLCTYFAAYDSKAGQVFIGHHKKSGLWLFNGGHIDKGETMNETLVREIGEEWGLDGNDFEIKPPAFLTITEIDNPTKQPCNFHYDLWCFISVDKNSFSPVESKLLEEFHEAGWKNLEEARSLIKDKNTSLAIDFIESNYFNSK